MKAKLIKQLKSIVNIAPDRIYFDVPDALVKELFDIYDPADIYSYLTQKERNLAYKDLQGINANSEQVKMEWMKKAAWRAAKAECWNDDLYELDESVLKENKMYGFDRGNFMSYLGSEFALDGFSIRLVENIIEYGLEHETNSDDQFASFLEEVLPEVEFGEIAAFCDDDILSDDGRKKKVDWIVMHPDVKEFITESKKSGCDEFLEKWINPRRPLRP